MPSPLRQSVERASLPAITRLSTLPPAVPFLVQLVLLLGGVLIGGPTGFVLTGIAAAFVAWLLYLSWPRLSGVERLMRSAILLLTLAICVTRLFPR